MSEKDNLKIGHHNIDQHHQEIFKLTNKLEQAIEKQDKSLLNEVICFLEEHTLEHFKEEEELMEKHQFYDYKNHQKDHLIFTKKIHDLRNLFQSNCPLPLCIYYVRRFTDQLIHHVITVDMKLKNISIKAPIKKNLKDKKQALKKETYE